MGSRERWTKELLWETQRACAYCGEPFGSIKDATLDHVIPRWAVNMYRLKTGIENFVLACGPCNERKGDRLPPNMELPDLEATYREGPWEVHLNGSMVWMGEA